jgi:protein SERAC1
MASGRTFRIQGVPLNWGAEQVQTFLANHEDLQLEDGVNHPIIESLAEEVHGRSRTGTVSFQSLPSKLQKNHRCKLILPSSFTGSRPARAQALSLDDEFLGITTLYSPSLEDLKIE